MPSHPRGFARSSFKHVNASREPAKKSAGVATSPLLGLGRCPVAGGSVQARGPVRSLRGLPSVFPGLDSVETALVARELVGFDAHSLQDGDEEMGEGDFMIARVALPT